MARLERTATINAPVSMVFAYIASPGNEVEYVPGVFDISDIKGQGVGTTCRWSYKMVGIVIEGEAKVTEYVPNQRYTIETTGGIESSWIWNFEDALGDTKLDLVIDYEIPVPVLSKVGEAELWKLQEHEADFALAVIKSRLAAELARAPQHGRA